MRRFACIEAIQGIAPTLCWQTAKLMEVIINNFHVETERQKQDGTLYFLGMRDALEAQGIITPQQSADLRKYMTKIASQTEEGGEN